MNEGSFVHIDRVKQDRFYKNLISLITIVQQSSEAIKADYNSWSIFGDYLDLWCL